MSKNKEEAPVQAGDGGFQEPEHGEPVQAPGLPGEPLIAPEAPNPAWPKPAYHQNLGKQIDELKEAGVLREVFDDLEDHIATEAATVPVYEVTTSLEYPTSPWETNFIQLARRIESYQILEEELQRELWDILFNFDELFTVVEDKYPGLVKKLLSKLINKWK